MLWAVIRERSAIPDQKRGKSRFSFPRNPLYAPSARQRWWEERLCSQVSIFSLQENLRAQGNCPTLLPCSSEQLENTSPHAKTTNARTRSGLISKTWPTDKSIKGQRDDNPTGEKNCWGNSVIPLKHTSISSLPCDTSVTISHYISPPVGYCSLTTEGYWSHTTAVKKISLHFLCMSVQMPVTHVTWQWRLLRLTLHRSPTRMPK